MLDLSIIIVNWNTKELTLKCLESVFKYTKGISFEVIVVDNGSSDKSATEIKKKYRKKVIVIENEENIGFGRANNQGMKIAQGRYFCLLNSDTLLIGNIFDRLVEWFDANTFVPLRTTHKFAENFLHFSHIPSGMFKRLPIGVIGCKLLNPDRSVQHSIMSFPTLGTVFNTFFLSRLLPQVMPRRSVEVDSVMGAFMLLKREVYERTGGFDENIFLYVEEVEWAYRIKKEGFSIAYWPEATVIHFGRGSSTSGRREPVLHIFRNLRYFYKKHYNRGQLAVLDVMIRLKCYLTLLYARITGNKSLIRTYSEALSIPAEKL